ncbi:T6SS immunity protein Tli4 family protein [Massilia sp. X63]|uniref:T6SS immunity protein Tli4 family protein n=1 Tax=Massilia sp. X63 TaxID=3237285 RepID=UPI0034DCE281
MRRLFRTGLAVMLAGVVIAGLARTWHTGAKQDKHEVARMTEKMKTVCVGRFLLDVPAETHYEFHRPRVGGFDIAVFDETEDEFQKRVMARKTQLEATPDRPGGLKNLESVSDVQNDYGVKGQVFVHNRDISEGQSSDGLTVERYRYESVSVEALVHGNGISVDLSAPSYDPETIGKLAKLIAQLVPNPGNRIPSGPGFCIDRAYFRDPLGAEQREEVMLAAWLPNRPDVVFKVMLAAGTEPDRQGLLERGADSDTRLGVDEKARVSRLRADKRTIDGIEGEELVERFVENNDAFVYSFWWEVNGTENNVFIPHIVFKMDTGHSERGPVPSSLSESAATCLWDTVLSSLRLRPTERMAVQPVSVSGISIGTQALAGDSCPESGWWECTDGSKEIGVMGGRRQYFKKGEPMPQALLLPPQSLWDKVRGLQPNFESKTPTSWKLVDHRTRKRQSPQLPLAKASASIGTTVSIAMSDDVGRNGPAVGSFSSTGVPCPVSGWWRCEESAALDGTRWFAQGSVLPPATFSVAPRIFGHASGAPQAIQRRSAWRLMRLADSPGGTEHETAGAALGVLPPDREV